MDFDRKQAIAVLNSLLETELSGAVRYTQYSLMVFGHSRIPIVGWMRKQAAESLTHATLAGEEVTSLGGQPSLEIGKLVGSHHRDIDSMMEEMLIHEQKGIDLYNELLQVVEGKNVSLEEYARAMIRDEEHHISEIRKMLRGSA